MDTHSDNPRPVWPQIASWENLDTETAWARLDPAERAFCETLYKVLRDGGPPEVRVRPDTAMQSLGEQLFREAGSVYRWLTGKTQPSRSVRQAIEKMARTLDPPAQLHA